MNSIPKDPNMLYSFVNMMLRDNYSSLEELCAAYDADRFKNRKYSGTAAV